jgi:hypothetical protein
MRLKLIELCAVQSGTVVWPYSLGLGLWCLMPLSTIFQLYRGIKFYCGFLKFTSSKCL